MTTRLGEEALNTKLPEHIKEDIYLLGLYINNALMEVVWFEHAKAIYHDPKLNKVRELVKKIRSELEKCDDEVCIDALNAVEQIEEMVGFTLKELEKLEKRGIPAEHIRHLVAWLARAQQEVLYLLHRF